MGIIDNMTGVLSKAGVKAKKTYETARVEIKIKGYSKENQDLFVELGRLIYDSRIQSIEPDEERLNDIISSISVVNSRIKHMEKLLNVIKREQPVGSASEPGKTGSDKQEQKRYASLNKKADDLKITRTEKGIAVLRFCPKCDTGNNPGVSECVNCGHAFILSQ